MDWNPKDWAWAPRLDEGFGWLCRTVGRTLIYALKAILNIDRWNFRSMWTGLGRAPRNYVRLLSCVFLILSPFWVWMIFEVWDEIQTLTGDTVPRDTSDDLRNIAYALGVTITALAGLLAAPLILIRTWVGERQTATAEQGLITDRITRAVEQLGAEKTVRRREFKPLFKVDAKGKWTRDTDGNPVPATRPDGTPLGEWESVEQTLPNLEVRLGAIYALERIAQDSERDHIPIMETLCAYIRENAPDSDAVDDDTDDWPDWPDDADDEVHARMLADLRTRIKKLEAWVGTLPAPRVDIQAALSVIGRRSPDRIAHERRQRSGGRKDGPGFRLYLRNTNLQHADLTRAQLDDALLIGARMQGADLRGARMQGAYLWEARMQGANLGEARMQEAILGEVRMQGAYLLEARMRGANLWEARMEGAILSRARMQGADLRGANLRSESLTQDQVDAAFGDSATILPPGITMPGHWDTETIERLDPDPK